MAQGLNSLGTEARNFREKLLQQSDKSSVPVEACFSGWQGTDGFQYGAILRDISVRKREAERIRYLAEYDPLTGLANRNTLHDSLSVMIFNAEK